MKIDEQTWKSGALSVRAFKVLQELGITETEEIGDVTDRHLLNQPLCGHKTVREIRLFANGVSLDYGWC